MLGQCCLDIIQTFEMVVSLHKPINAFHSGWTVSVSLVILRSQPLKITVMQSVHQVAVSRETLLSRPVIHRTDHMGGPSVLAVSAKPLWGHALNSAAGHTIGRLCKGLCCGYAAGWSNKNTDPMVNMQVLRTGLTFIPHSPCLPYSIPQQCIRLISQNPCLSYYVLKALQKIDAKDITRCSIRCPLSHYLIAFIPYCWNQTRINTCDE